MFAAMHECADISTSAGSMRSPRRLALASAGVCCVGFGAVGVVVPGMPTTIFLIAACACFTRSCPWLEDRLVRNRFFRPFLVYLDSGAAMPRRAQIVALLMMWTAISVSSATFIWRFDPAWPAVAAVVIAGMIGTRCIIRAGRTRCDVELQRRIPGIGRPGGR